MQKTTNLKLNKPDYSDVADIADINANMDKLDSEVYKNTTAISNINSNKADKTHNHNNGADLTNVNAVKLNGKSASDFAAASVISNGDFNAVINAGIYTMRSCANSPYGGGYYGLLVVNSDTGGYVEQMAFKEGAYKVFIRYCYGFDDNTGGLDWSAWEEIGSKYAEKLRIFDVDGITLKDTNGINDIASITPKQVTENEARLTGFDTNKYWFNFGIPNQTLKVPYADMAIRALSFGLQAIPADTGVVRNVEGISDAVMNDPLFPVGYITRTHTSPYSPINGREYHIIYLPSTKAYGTQIAIIEQAFHGKVNSSSGWNLIVYMRSGHERINISASETTTYRNRGYTVTKDPSDDSKYIAADWSEWVKINTTPRIYQPAFSVSNSTTNRSLTFYEKDLDLVIKDIYQRILGLNYYTHPTTAGYKHIPSGGSAGQILKWSSAGTAQWANESGYTHPTTSGNKHIPSGGGTGQILRWSSDGTARWGNETAYTHPTYSGYKHIPSGGSGYDILSYGGSSGTASWVKNTKSYISKRNISIVNDKYYGIIDATYFNASSYEACGSVLVTLNVYDNSENKNRQTLVFRLTIANGHSENRKIDIIQNVSTGEPFFDEIIYRALNEERLFLTASRSASGVSVEITADSSLSGGIPSYVACFEERDHWHDGADHYSSNVILYPNSYTSTHRITSESVAAGSTTLANNEVLIKY